MITRRDFLKVTAAGGALASLGSVTEAKAAMKSAVPDEGFCHEGARKIPVIAEVDLVSRICLHPDRAYSQPGKLDYLFSLRQQQRQ